MEPLDRTSCLQCSILETVLGNVLQSIATSLANFSVRSSKSYRFSPDYLPSFHNELKVNVWDLFFGIWNLSFGICPAESRDHRTHIILQFLGLPGRDSIMIHEHRKDKLLSVRARYIPG
jgi:hypothetical protein